MYSALCDVASVCVSYDLSAPDEVLSVEVGVCVWSVQLVAGIRHGRFDQPEEIQRNVLTVFNAHDATSQSFRCANATAMINSAFRIYYCTSKYVTC